MQTKKITYSLLALLIATSFILPGSVSAKNDKKENRGNGNTSVSASQQVKVRVEKQERGKKKEEKRKQKKEEKREAKSASACFRAFGHFIAPGWLKKNDRPLINENCFFPFGIWKKLSGRVGTTTPPVVDTS